MSSATYYPSCDLSITNTSISRNQLCLSVSDPTLAAAEANTPNMARQLIKRNPVAVNYRHRRDAHAPDIEHPYRRTAEDVQDFRQEGQVNFGSDKCSRSASNLKTSLAFCTASGKPGPISASLCASPSYILLSDVLETMTNTRSLCSLATSGPDDASYAVNEYAIHVPDLPSLANQALSEELCVRGYLERPDHYDGNGFLSWLRRTFVPWVLLAFRNCWPKQVTHDAVSLISPQRPPPKAFGRCGGLAVVDALKCADIEEDPRTPPPTRLRTMLTLQEQSVTVPRTPSSTIPCPSDKSIYWSCQSLLTIANSSAFPSVQESPLSASSFCHLHEFSYATSHTTPSSSPERADFREMDDVLGTTDTTSSIYEAALQSCAPRIAMLNVKRPYVGLGVRRFPNLWYAEVCHHRLV